MPNRPAVSSALAHLARAARAMSQKIATGDEGAGDSLEAFHDAVGDRLDDAKAADDLALATASLAVALEYWRLTARPRVAATIAFATRHSVCKVVADVAQRLRASPADECSMIGAARDVAHAIVHQRPEEQEVLVHFIEPLLAEFDPNRRRDLGVYFTPIDAVNFLVEQSDRVLREQFGCPRGLADDRFENDSKSTLVILDPAMGTGVFLMSAIRRMRANVRVGWSRFISESLLPRLFGCEILPAVFVVANFLIADELVHGGFSPGPDDRLRLTLGDSLAMPSEATVRPSVILGNPPYRGISSNEHAWISRLLHGEAPDGSAAASYFHVDGKKLGERKTWLHDDYVKFFRYAQWQVEQSGAGIVAFLTNHGFLDNPTFRGMRSGLLQTFDRIEVIDLHGNMKKGTADGDESIFRTAQGMAMTVAWRSEDSSCESVVLRGDLRGTRSDKLARLSASHGRSIAMTRIAPSPPHYFFHADSSDSHPEYEAGFRLPDIMPVNTTAAVTARDWFVVDIDRAALVARLREFADLSITDAAIRQRYFRRTRSSKYPPGDTRGWKLTEARRRMAGQSDWERHIRRCFYRPFDQRWVFWTPWMIDWPRHDVMRHMQRGNPTLVCRRQSVRGQPCNFFWIADDLVLDGYIRSDNRGSESVFPLFLLNGDSLNDATCANLSQEFIRSCERQWRLNTSEDASDDQVDLHPRELLHYIYALFHSPKYRTRYASQLCVDFPRVLIPQNVGLFRRLSQLGKQLVAAHLVSGEADVEYDVTFTGACPLSAEAGFPKYDSGRVCVGNNGWFQPVPKAAWEFRVGAHQVLRKWLKDRRRGILNNDDVRTYQGLVRSVLRTQRIMRDVDDAIKRAGGWPGAFVAGLAS